MSDWFSEFTFGAARFSGVEFCASSLTIETASRKGSHMDRGQRSRTWKKNLVVFPKITSIHEKTLRQV